MYEKSFSRFLSFCNKLGTKDDGSIQSGYILLVNQTMHSIGGVSRIPDLFINDMDIKCEKFFNTFPKIDINTVSNEEIKASNDLCREIYFLLCNYLAYKIYNEYKDITLKINVEFNSYKEKTKETYDEFVKKVNELYAEEGLASYGKSYGDQEKKMARSRIGWLFCAILLIIVVLITLCILMVSQCLGYIPFFDIPYDINSFSINALIYLFTIKFFMLSIMIFAISWCVKMYRLARQQELVNNNKALITKTYNCFMEGTTDPAVKNTILASAATELFALPNTGFVPGKESNLDVLEQTTKIATALVSKAKPTGTS